MFLARVMRLFPLKESATSQMHMCVALLLRLMLLATNDTSSCLVLEVSYRTLHIRKGKTESDDNSKRGKRAFIASFKKRNVTRVKPAIERAERDGNPI